MFRSAIVAQVRIYVYIGLKKSVHVMDVILLKKVLYNYTVDKI